MKIQLITIAFLILPFITLAEVVDIKVYFPGKELGKLSLYSINEFLTKSKTLQFKAESPTDSIVIKLPLTESAFYWFEADHFRSFIILEPDKHLSFELDFDNSKLIFNDELNKHNQLLAGYEHAALHGFSRREKKELENVWKKIEQTVFPQLSPFGKRVLHTHYELILFQEKKRHKTEYLESIMCRGKEFLNIPYFFQMFEAANRRLVFTFSHKSRQFPNLFDKPEEAMWLIQTLKIARDCPEMETLSMLLRIKNSALAGFPQVDLTTSYYANLLDSIMASNRSNHFAYLSAYNLKKIIDPELSTAPAFNLPDTAGSVLSLENFRGKVVLLNFWATWCIPCINSMKSYPELLSIYGDRLEIVSISADRNINLVKNFLKNNNYNWTFLYAGQGHSVLSQYHVLAYPTYFLIDPEGMIIGRTSDPKKMISEILGD